MWRMDILSIFLTQINFFKKSWASFGFSKLSFGELYCVCCVWCAVVLCAVVISAVLCFALLCCTLLCSVGCVWCVESTEKTRKLSASERWRVCWQHQYVADSQLKTSVLQHSGFVDDRGNYVKALQNFVNQLICDDLKADATTVEPKWWEILTRPYGSSKVESFTQNLLHHSSTTCSTW